MRKYLGLIAVLASLSVGLGLMNTANLVQIYAQSTQFPNNTETATEFADVTEGNDTATIQNNTNIGNTNNTFADSTDVNIREDCMQVPGQSEPYCP
jgi:hypothetical protein